VFITSIIKPSFLGITVSLNEQTYTVIESGFSVIVSAVLLGNNQGRLERDLVVTVRTTDGTATQRMLYV